MTTSMIAVFGLWVARRMFEPKVAQSAIVEPQCGVPRNAIATVHLRILWICSSVAGLKFECSKAYNPVSPKLNEY